MYYFGQGTPFSGKPEPRPAKERPDGMKLARHYLALLDSGKFESRAALARHLGVSRARVTQVLNRLKNICHPGKEWSPAAAINCRR
jgi:hypothetical protein